MISRHIGRYRWTLTPTEPWPFPDQWTVSQTKLPIRPGWQATDAGVGGSVLGNGPLMQALADPCWLVVHECRIGVDLYRYMIHRGADGSPTEMLDTRPAAAASGAER
jgi:hypothetical protein